MNLLILVPQARLPCLRLFTILSHPTFSVKSGVGWDGLFGVVKDKVISVSNLVEVEAELGNTKKIFRSYCPKYDLDRCQSCDINKTQGLSCEVQSIQPSPPLCILPVNCISTHKPSSTSKTTTSKPENDGDECLCFGFLIFLSISIFISYLLIATIIKTTYFSHVGQEIEQDY